MTELQFQAPIEWPSFIPLTERLHRTSNPQFSMTMTERDAIGYLQDEINQTSAITSAKLYTNAENMMSTQPTTYISREPGAAVRVKIEGKNYAIACDRWMMLQHNIYALHLAIRQFRKMHESGLGALPLLMAGFNEQNAQGQSASGASEENWYQVLELHSSSTLDDANNAYREKAKSLGPQDPDGLQRLNLAIAAAREYFSG
jgi:hypothetical protein